MAKHWRCQILLILLWHTRVLAGMRAGGKGGWIWVAPCLFRYRSCAKYAVMRGSSELHP
jgi:hypothetical protein